MEDAIKVAEEKREIAVGTNKRALRAGTSKI